MRPSRRGSIPLAVAQFAISGLLGVVLLGVIGVQLLRSTSTSEATRSAKDLTRLAGEGIVAPSITAGVVAGTPAAVAALDRIVRARVLRDPVVRVKVWNARSDIIYSDEPRLIGAHYALPADELQALRSGGTNAEVSDLTRPENRFERGQHKLLEVYHGIQGPNGQRLLFEDYLRFSSVSASATRLWESFAPALIGALLLLELAQIPLAWSLARRLRRGQQEREMLLQRAIDASDVERERLAVELHDGVVQNLVGVSYSLGAVRSRLEDAVEPGSVGESVDRAALETRRSIRQLRTLLVDLYPPDLHRVGLPAALTDLLAPLADRQVNTTLNVDPELRLPPDVEALLFRVAQEALRNVVRHAEARAVEVSVERVDARAHLAVADDGRGFEPAAEDGSSRGGHFGLRILRDLTDGAKGELRVRSTPGEGTTVEVEVPVE